MVMVSLRWYITYYYCSRYESKYISRQLKCFKWAHKNSKTRFGKMMPTSHNTKSFFMVTFWSLWVFDMCVCACGALFSLNALTFRQYVFFLLLFSVVVYMIMNDENVVRSLFIYSFMDDIMLVRLFFGFYLGFFSTHTLLVLYIFNLLGAYGVSKEQVFA